MTGFRILRTETKRFVNNTLVGTDVEEKTVCTECNRELKSAEEWSRHKRDHTVDRLVATEEGRKYLEMMKGMLKPDAAR